MKSPSGRMATPQIKVGRSDLILLATVIALCLFGLLMVYSASPDFSIFEHDGNPYYILNKQILWMVLGALIVAMLTRLDYHLIQRLAVPLMGLTLALLVLVLLRGEERLHSVRTLYQGSIQPSELAKLVIVLYLAVWLYSKRDHLKDIQIGLIPLAVIVGTVGGLIYLQPDLSAAATIFIMGGLLFFLAGGDLKQILFFLLVALLIGGLVIQFSETGRHRLADYLTGLREPLQSSDHMLYSLESIVKGGLFGQGLGNATTKLEGLPLPTTDSIFAVVVEEWGLLGAIVLIVLYGVLVWRGLKVAERAPDMLGTLLAGGLTFWIAIEALINMAVLVGLLPFAGNALPFMSAGGSNLLSVLTAVGIVLNISRYQAQRPSETVVQERRSYSASVDWRGRNGRRGVSRIGRP
ncbi:MAG: putative lipid II flippase FtsW [Anaerolineales bacterium]|nr:putative lipid II flippase FtsW [Anaerolineales bacterium]MCX7607848.1 putative lipid II flippase FtsW [Anaerolineales bacterium]MDW8227857.1 putative peptidoglycan glycosyltransferase FtsW [Anaerolineales bacterium]